jgi:hypothetical protein
VAKSQTSPLVTEWPASEKANLEARLREGGVVVSYAGCAMRLLPQCRVKGSYVWQRTTPATDVMEIQNEDELYAKLPLGAVSLEGELKSSGRLAVQTTVSGQFRLQGLSTTDVPSTAECAGATHIVSSLSVGAFKLKSGGTLSAGGGAKVAVIGNAHAGTSSSESVLRQAGDADRCGDSTGEAPASSCASPLQMFLAPLPNATHEGPPGTVKIDFVAAKAGTTWEVTAGDHVLCQTPCSRWIDPATPLRMQAFLGKNPKGGKIDLPDIREMAAQGPLEIRAHPMSKSLLALGITFTSLGGVTVLTGGILAGIGCSADDSPGLCKGGLYTLGTGAVVTAGSIWMILQSGAYHDVRTLETTASSSSSSVARESGGLVVHWGPGVVSGTF